MRRIAIALVSITTAVAVVAILTNRPLIDFLDFSDDMLAQMEA